MREVYSPILRRNIVDRKLFHESGTSLVLQSVSRKTKDCPGKFLLALAIMSSYVKLSLGERISGLVTPPITTKIPDSETGSHTISAFALPEIWAGRLMFRQVSFLMAVIFTAIKLVAIE